MSANAKSAAERAFVSHFGSQPDGIAIAPGRVNLIGEHVDYNDGIVMPMPVPHGTAVAWSSQPGSQIDIFAADLDAADSFDAMAAEKLHEPDWRSYARGMVKFWPERLTGMRLAIAGDLPRGVGLSSSASLCIALGRAFEESLSMPLDAVSLAKIAQRTEHEYAGVACGIMDQMAVAAGQAGRALLLDCRDLSYRHLDIPDDWCVAIIDTGVTRSLMDGEFNLRRSQCLEACHALGLSSLRDAKLANLNDAGLDDTLHRRARHVVSEIERVKKAALALQDGDLATFGALFNQSHASLRDDFSVSVPAVDQLVDTLNASIAGGGGARMTGAGFGGAVVAVFDRERLPKVVQSLPDPTRLITM